MEAMFAMLAMFTMMASLAMGGMWGILPRLRNAGHFGNGGYVDSRFTLPYAHRIAPIDNTVCGVYYS